MIGSLVKFSCEKRDLFFPNTPRYEVFDERVGLVTSYTKKGTGEEHVRVQWLQQFHWNYHDHHVVFSDFNLLNFEIVGRA